MSVEVCSPVTRLAAHRPFSCKIGQHTEEIAIHCHTTCEPRPDSPSTTECVTVFGQLEVLSGKSRISVSTFRCGATLFVILVPYTLLVPTPVHDSDGVMPNLHFRSQKPVGRRRNGKPAPHNAEVMSDLWDQSFQTHKDR